MRIGAKVIGIIMLIAVVSALVAAATGPTEIGGSSNPVPPPPSFVINTTLTTLCRGEVNYIPFNVYNNGYQNGYGQAPPMQTVELTIAPTKGLYSAGGGIAQANTIQPGNFVTMVVPEFVASNASSFISTSTQIVYNYYNLYSDTEIRNVSFTAEDCQMPLSVNISPYILTSGTIENITVTLRNSGATTLNAIAIKLSVPNNGGGFLTPQPVQIDSIAPMNTTSFNESMYVSENQTSQSIPLNVSVNYYNGTQLEQISATHSVLSSGIINLTPSEFTVSPAIPTPLSVFSVSFVLTNIGTAGASALTVTPLPPRGFTVYGANSSFVGSIGVDTQTPVTVSLIAGNTVKAGTYKIPIRINYLNNLRDNITTWANTSVAVGQAAFNASTATVYRERASGSSGFGLVEIALVLAVIVLAVLFYLERRKRIRTERKK